MQLLLDCQCQWREQDAVVMEEKHWSRVHMHAAAGDGDWFDERLFAAETSSLYKWKKRCSKPSWYGDSPLHLAVLKGRIDVVKDLIKSGAAIGAFNTMGWSPLHCAACSGNVEMVKLLLQNGANAAAVDEKRRVKVTDVMQGDSVAKLLEAALSKGGVVVRRKADEPPPPEVDLRAADKSKLLTSGYYLLKCLESMGDISVLPAFSTALKSLFYKGWKGYASGEKQMDRALALLKAFVVSSRAAPPPKPQESSSSSSSSSAARLPSLLDYAVATHLRPREGTVVVYRWQSPPPHAKSNRISV